MSQGDGRRIGTFGPKRTALRPDVRRWPLDIGMPSDWESLVSANMGKVRYEHR